MRNCEAGGVADATPRVSLPAPRSGAARSRDTLLAERIADGIEATIANLNPPAPLLAKHGVLPPPRDFVLTLERVGAHVRAFTRAASRAHAERGTGAGAADAR